MKKFPDVPSTLPKLIAADKEKNHFTDKQEVIRINKYIADPNKKLNSYEDKVIPSAYSDWISHNKKRNRRPVDGTQRHAIAIMLDVEYIETIFSNGLEIIPFMAQTFDFVRKRLPKPSDKSISKKVIALNNETLKLFLASKNLEKIAELCDSVYNFDKYRNELIYTINGSYNNNLIASVSTWLDANYSVSKGKEIHHAKRKAYTLATGNPFIHNYYAFDNLPISEIEDSYINYNFIYTALNVTIQYTESLLLNAIYDVNNTLNTNSSEYEAYSFLTYDNIYYELSNRINKLNSIALQDREFIFNSVINLICMLLNKTTENFKDTIFNTSKYNCSKDKSRYSHPHYILAEKVEEAKELFEFLPEQFDQEIKKVLMKNAKLKDYKYNESK